MSLREADPLNEEKAIKRARERHRRREVGRLPESPASPEVAGLTMVACVRTHTRLTAAGCARLFLSTIADTPRLWEGRAACATCAVGAARAGRSPPPAHPGPTGGHWCFRCSKPAERVISGRVCVSCYNREREALGSTATAAVKAKPGIRDLRARLARRELIVMKDGVARTFTTPPVRDVREALDLAAARFETGMIGRPAVTWDLALLEAVAA